MATISYISADKATTHALVRLLIYNFGTDGEAFILLIFLSFTFYFIATVSACAFDFRRFETFLSQQYSLPLLLLFSGRRQ